MTDNESATQDLNEGYVPIYATHIMLKFKSEQFDGQKILKDVVFKIFVLQDNDVLTSVRFQLSDDQELDFLYEADYDSERFEQIKQEQNLEIEFEDFPNVIRQLITTINNQGTDELEEGDYKLSFKDHDTSGEDHVGASLLISFEMYLPLGSQIKSIRILSRVFASKNLKNGVYLI